MTRTVKSHRDVLKKLHGANPAERRNILSNAGCGLIKCICEIVHNTLNGVIRLQPRQRRKLKRHTAVLRKLARSGDRWEEKKKIINQTGGGFLPLLLAPIITGLFSKLFG